MKRSGAARVLAVIFATMLAACSHTTAKPQPRDTFPQLYAQLKDSVVLLSMKAPSDDPKRAGAVDDAYGSGVIVASGSWGSQILTDQHVIDKASNLRATISDARKVPVRVIAVDMKNDFALLQTPEKNLKVAPLGDSETITPGAAVGVLGYPIPDAFESEGLGTKLSVYNGRIASVRKGAFELDLPIIPGESGGPVFETETGTVIGVAESRFDEERAIGFATPIDLAKPLIRAHAPRGLTSVHATR